MSSGSEGWSGSEGYSGGERGFKIKKHKGKKDKDKGKDKDKKDKDKDKDKGKDKDKDKKDKDKKDKDKDKDKKDKKDKDKKDKGGEDKDKPHEGAPGGTHGHGVSGPGYGAGIGGGHAAEFLSGTTQTTVNFQAQVPGHGAPAPPPYASSPAFPQAGVDIKAAPQFPSTPQPPAIGGNAPPPSGYRVPLRTDAPFPPPDQAGPPVAYDADGVSPIFIGSALFENAVHPCKIGPHLQPYPSVPYGGSEYGHNGRYDLLPFVPGQMEWVPTANGQIPPGRRAIEGGYEENGGKLYHALAVVNGVNVPGKTGEHLGGANVAFGGQECAFQQYQILCWK